MKLTVDFDKLFNKLDYVSSIVDDNLIAQDMKNFTFKIEQGKVTIITYNPNTVSVCKSYISSDDFKLELEDSELNDGVLYVQLKSKELLNFLNSFTSLTKTKPTSVVIETMSLKVRVTVYEEALNPEDSVLNQASRWTFDNIPIKGAILKELNKEIPREGASTVNSVDLLLYLKSLFPLLSNEGANNLPSKLHFSDTHVVAVNTMTATLFNNGLPEQFKNLVITYPTVNFLLKMVDGEETVSVVKTDMDLLVFTDSVDAIFRYQTKMPDTSIYLSRFQKDHAIVLDRKFFRDVIKRLSLINEQIVCEVDAEENVLKVKNSKFEQSIPIYQTKGLEELSGAVKFKMASQVLNKVIIGDDSVFPDDIRIYFVPAEPMGYSLFFSDSTGNWMSVIQVR